jgi:hypothetical protein
MPIRFKSKRIMGDHKGLHGRLGPKDVPRRLRGRIPRDEIWIRKGVCNKADVIRHERVEVHLMKNRNMRYKQAHRIANKYG